MDYKRAAKQMKNEMIKKPTLSIAKRLFKRRNPDVKGLKVEWRVKPIFVNDSYNSQVVFKAEGYSNKTMNLYSDIYETCIY